MQTTYSQSPPPHHLDHQSPGQHSRQPSAHSPYPAPVLSSMTPGSSPTNSPARKPPKLRVHIPEATTPPPQHQDDQYQHKRTISSSSMHSTDEETTTERNITTSSSTKEESSREKKSTMASTTTITTIATAATNDEPSSAGPPSALPSQFAQNLPSPSSFYPDFFQQSELPSPLNFSATPTVGNTFHWPPASKDYKPSPLAKLGSDSHKRTKEDIENEKDDDDDTISKKQKN
ncbi:hypothetical protein BC941DRAFT_160587 [Chlamydoabsidia padenii]|nr:hypothetical protein BC941DRAFT_160587 [Chlamydoabsidia padenii]